MGATDLGALRDYMVIDERQLQKIPDEMSFEEAALMEPIGIGLHCMNRINPQIGDSLTIFGRALYGIDGLFEDKKIVIKNSVFLKYIEDCYI